jgi:hypothetical protein
VFVFSETSEVTALSARSVPERICDFLRDRVGRAYCDDCVQERLGLKWRQQVQTITATLAVTGLFARTVGVCSTCNQEKQVTRAAQNARDQASVHSKSREDRDGRDDGSAGHRKVEI